MMNSTVQRQLAELHRELKSRKDAKSVIDALDVTQHIAPVYLPLHDDIQAAAHQYYNLPGGRGSGKSSFCALEIVSGIMHDTTGSSSAIVFRRTANTMRESVYSQIAWAIDILDVNELWRGNVSPMSWTYKPTGAQIVFRGLDDSSKLKSIKPTRGTFRYIWFEEFSELPGPNFTRNVMQSVQRGGDNFTVFRSFNPPISKNAWANVFIQEPDARAITLKTDYTQIPPAWLGDAFLYEAHRLQEVNPTAYLHEYMGEPTGTGGEVFPNLEIREITDDEIDQMGYIFQGLDFGFAADPACFLRVSYDRKKEIIYLLDEIYKRSMSNKQLSEAIKAKGYHLTGKPGYRSPTFGTMYGPERAYIVCDAAEPKSIADLQGTGLRAIPCRKYNGSVVYGVRWLQRRKIVIDPARTPNAYREFSEYSYMVSKDGEILSDLPDKGNHTIDAVRYALDGIINQRKYPA